MTVDIFMVTKQSGTESLEKLPETETTIKVYKRRFWMLFLFSTLSLLCGMLFPQYVAMADITSCYYDVNEESVNWTTLIFMVVYLVLIFPVSYLMNRVGLRNVVLLGSVCNTLACAVQFATLKPNRFDFVILSSFFASLSNVFVLSIPPCVAAIWFPENEVSRACAFGVFGNQLGIALGFIFSPLLISNDCSNKDLISIGKQNVAIILTSINTLILVLAIFTFQNKPKYPPSLAEAQKKQEVSESYLKSALSLMKNVNFLLVFIMYGLMVGTYFALVTVLNNLLLRYFPSKGVEIGWMGTLLIVAGLIGSIIAGYILDYTHRFKETAMGLCILSFLCHIVFSCLLTVNKLWLQFVTLGIYGFFLTSFLPVGFEYAIEVTYPESEVTSAGLLNSATMIFGIAITEATSYALVNKGSTYSNVVMGASLIASSIISGFITRNYRRSQQNKKCASIT